MIEFDAGHRVPRSKLQDQPLHLRDLSGIAQHTLVERDCYGGFKRHSRLLLTLIKTCEESRSFIAPTWTDFNSLGLSRRMYMEQHRLAVSDRFPADKIRALNLSFGGTESVPSGSTYLRQALSLSLEFNTAALLRNASNLRSLTLAPLGRSEDRVPYLRVATGVEPLQVKLFYRKCFPHLRHLDMNGFYTSEDYLRTFLKDHAATLRRLRLSNMVLYQGSDLPSVRAIKSFTRSNLSRENEEEPDLSDSDFLFEFDTQNDPGTAGLAAVTHGGSWINLLAFVRADLNLNDLQLGGFLLEGLPEMSFENLEEDHADSCWTITNALERVCLIDPSD